MFFGEGNHLTVINTIVLNVNFYICPTCGKESIFAIGEHCSLGGGKTFKIFPQSSSFALFPDYIPQNIRNDYEEASAIVEISPKSAATLCRRCLQSMIYDFWKIEKKKNLKEEIEALQCLIPETQ